MKLDGRSALLLSSGIEYIPVPNPSPRCDAHPISLIPFEVRLMAIVLKFPVSKIKSNN